MHIAPIKTEPAALDAVSEAMRASGWEDIGKKLGSPHSAMVTATDDGNLTTNPATICFQRGREVVRVFVA